MRCCFNSTRTLSLLQASDSVFAGDVLIGVDDQLFEAGQTSAYSSLIVRFHSQPYWLLILISVSVKMF